MASLPGLLAFWGHQDAHAGLIKANEGSRVLPSTLLLLFLAAGTAANGAAYTTLCLVYPLLFMSPLTYWWRAIAAQSAADLSRSRSESPRSSIIIIVKGRRWGNSDPGFLPQICPAISTRSLLQSPRCQQRSISLSLSLLDPTGLNGTTVMRAATRAP